MKTVYLLTGSNVGNRLSYLKQAVWHLKQHESIELSELSAIFETAAWGKTDQASFYNQALQLQTDLLAEDLLDLVLRIEKELGRERKKRWGPRVIDIDIIFYGMEIVNKRDLKIPHPRMQDRRFVLAPLADISREIMHPVLQKNIGELLADCQDELEVISL